MYIICLHARACTVTYSRLHSYILAPAPRRRHDILAPAPRRAGACPRPRCCPAAGGTSAERAAPGTCPGQDSFVPCSLGLVRGLVQPHVAPYAASRASKERRANRTPSGVARRPVDLPRRARQVRTHASCPDAGPRATGGALCGQLGELSEHAEAGAPDGDGNAAHNLRRRARWNPAGCSEAGPMVMGAGFGRGGGGGEGGKEEEKEEEEREREGERGREGGRERETLGPTAKYPDGLTKHAAASAWVPASHARATCHRTRGRRHH